LIFDGLYYFGPEAYRGLHLSLPGRVHLLNRVHLLFVGLYLP
jgi:hypothetical protein